MLYRLSHKCNKYKLPVTPDLVWEWGYVLPLLSHQIWSGNEATFHCCHTRSGLGMKLCSTTVVTWGSGLGMRLCTIPAKGVNVCGYRADLCLLLYQDTGFHSNKWLSSPHIEGLVEVFQILLLFLQLQGLLFDRFDLLFLLSLLQRWWIQLEVWDIKVLFSTAGTKY